MDRLKDIKIRQPILFTRARPHKRLNKLLPRKQKHKTSCAC
jgi:hypothetical protein